MSLRKIKVAAVQASPAFLDASATLDRVEELCREAAREGAGLVVFPEAFVPGYPDWIWRSKPWGEGGHWFGRLLEEAVVVPGPVTERLGGISRRAGVYLTMGVNERDAHGSTLYNSLLYFDDGGQLLGTHRKLMPTGPERMVWGQGDGSGLLVLDTPFGRLGGLICWENYMPLARAAMYAQGVDILLAPTWDRGEAWVATLRHIGKEGRVYVVGVGTCMRGSDVPAEIGGRDELYGGHDDWLDDGWSAITDHTGAVLAGPLTGEAGILYADLDVEGARASRREFDPVGHYSRPDIFTLHVDRGQARSIVFEGAAAGTAAMAVNARGRAAPARVGSVSPGQPGRS
jgi:nitrilase